jgi:phosphoribosylcarboxyaminoimidazole (NCAIR) mutase
MAIYVGKAGKSAHARRIEAAVTELREMKIPVTVKNLGDVSRYLSREELAELARWIDTLDRI